MLLLVKARHILLKIGYIKKTEKKRRAGNKKTRIVFLLIISDLE